MWAKKIDNNFHGAEDLIEQFSGKMPHLMFVFEGLPTARNEKLSANLGAIFPDVPIIGCSTGTIIDGPSVYDEGSVAFAVGFEHTSVKIAAHRFGNFVDSIAIGQSLGQKLRSDDLAAILVFSDGLNINGSALVAGLTEAAGPTVLISGGLAGDGARFAQTFVYADGKSQSNVVAAVGLYGQAIRVAHGSAGGWDVFGPRREITRSVGNVLYELDGKPALDLYERYLGDEAADLPASGLLYPLQVWAPDEPDNQVVRTILSIDRDARSMTFAGDVPEGWSARLMRGHLDKLVDSATDAAVSALRALKDVDQKTSPSLCLTVSCVGRRLLLGQRTEEEVIGVDTALGGEIPQMGFYSYGEIVPHTRSRISGLHNQTLTLTLLAEAS